MQTAFHLADPCPRLALARDQRVVEMVAENRMRVEVENMRHRLAWHASPARLQSAHFNQRGLPKRSFETVDDAACFLAEHHQDGHFHPYRCSVCLCWHLGTNRRVPAVARRYRDEETRA